MITIEKATRKYGDIKAVSDVSLTIRRGEVVGLLGHNGAGKTTLMKMLTGYLEPTSGTITVGGADVVADRIAVQRQIGYLPENAPLYPEMLVQEYLLMLAELRGVPDDKRERAVSVAATRTGLGAHLVRPIRTLSKGFRQRVGIAQAIVHEPGLLVLDEPTNGLDPTQIEPIRALVRRLGKTSTIILSTHILQEVEAVCDRVLVLIDGRLAADAPLKELTTSHTMKLVTVGDADPRSALKSVAGVGEVKAASAEGAGRAWSLHTTDGAQIGAAVLDACHEAGVRVEALSPETLTLETVFRRLQQEHATRQEVAA
jgi:ABC-2 type transport system ATP-binding protein